MHFDSYEEWYNHYKYVFEKGVYYTTTKMVRIGNLDASYFLITHTNKPSPKRGRVVLWLCQPKRFVFSTENYFADPFQPTDEENELFKMEYSVDYKEVLKCLNL